MTLNEQFSQNIRRLRTEKRLSQEACAELCGVSSRYLGDMERGLANPTLEVVESFCAGLGATAAELFGEDTAERPAATSTP